MKKKPNERLCLDGQKVLRIVLDEFLSLGAGFFAEFNSNSNSNSNSSTIHMFLRIYTHIDRYR